MATILERLKAQLKSDEIDVSYVQTISQALRKIDSSVTGNTISECLDDLEIGEKSEGNPDSGPTNP